MEDEPELVLHAPDPRSKKLRKIGAGSYGACYRARVERTLEPRCVKKMTNVGAVNRGHLETSQLREVCINGMAAASSLRNKFPIADRALIHCSGVYSYLKIVMELCDRDLAMREGDPPLPIPLGRAVLGMARAVLACHMSGFLHRDIKPDNFLLCQGTIKIGDFGLSRPDVGMIVGGSSAGYMSGAVHSNWYRAPELFLYCARGTKVGPKAATYALGCCIFHLFTGEHLARALGLPRTDAEEDWDASLRCFYHHWGCPRSHTEFSDRALETEDISQRTHCAMNILCSSNVTILGSIRAFVGRFPPRNLEDEKTWHRVIPQLALCLNPDERERPTVLQALSSFMEIFPSEAGAGKYVPPEPLGSCEETKDKFDVPLDDPRYTVIEFSKKPRQIWVMTKNVFQNLGKDPDRCILGCENLVGGIVEVYRRSNVSIMELIFLGCQLWCATCHIQENSWGITLDLLMALFKRTRPIVDGTDPCAPAVEISILQQCEGVLVDPCTDSNWLARSWTQAQEVLKQRLTVAQFVDVVTRIVYERLDEALNANWVSRQGSKWRKVDGKQRHGGGAQRRRSPGGGNRGRHLSRGLRRSQRCKSLGCLAERRGRRRGASGGGGVRKARSPHPRDAQGDQVPRVSQQPVASGDRQGRDQGRPAHDPAVGDGGRDQAGDGSGDHHADQTDGQKHQRQEGEAQKEDGKG